MYSGIDEHKEHTKRDTRRTYEKSKRGKRQHNARACNSWYAERSKRIETEKQTRAAAAAQQRKRGNI